MTPIVYVDAHGAETILYAGCTETAAQAAINSVPGRMQAKFNATGANILFVGSNNTLIPGTHTLSLSTSSSTYADALGSGDYNERNALSGRSGSVYITHIRNRLLDTYTRYLADEQEYSGMFDNFTFPLSVSDLVKVIVNVGCHETGHMLGLVSDALGGSERHNMLPHSLFDPRHLMNSGTDVPFNFYFDVDMDGNEAIRYFYHINSAYLKWLLPKPQ